MGFADLHNVAVLFLLWCSCCISFAHSDLPPGGSNGTEDGLALLAFKARITQDPFHVVRSWNDSLSYCEWPGVICSDRQYPNKVIALHLQSSGLMGTMAPEIGNLSFLQNISLSNNSFYGKIPHEVSFLSKLRYLFLDNNIFGGEIIPNISSCSNLIELWLGNNSLMGNIPMELGLLSKFQLIQLDYNYLMGPIPSSIGNLSSLITFSARGNSFSGSIPDTLGQMTKLVNIRLGGNKLSGTIPPPIYNLSSLSVFDVGGNLLLGSLPPNLGYNLPDLSWFSIQGNQFYGQIPISISNLSKLELLSVADNNLTGKVTIHFGGLSKLNVLSMATNYLGSGEDDDLSFIDTLTNCSLLTYLQLGSNQFGGVLPNSIANLSSQLWKLSIPYNKILGNIPIGLDNLVSLQHLDLSGNLLTGPIPPSLGNLTLLTLLELSENRLDGEIPSSIGKCINLLRLGCYRNNLSGIIPKEIFDSVTLLELYLGGNYFSTSLPSEVGGLTNLNILDVSENMLSGEIPDTLGACTSLKHLFMEHNLLQGSIPLSMSSLKGLQDLDISHNNFTGFIPGYLGTFMYLRKLNLSLNHFEGELPTEGVFGNLSAISVIENNKLCGGIPELHLQRCQIRKSKKDASWFHVLNLIALICGCGVSLCLIFVALFFITYQRRKEKKESRTLSIGDSHFKISYAKLLEATNGFSSTNLVGMGHFGYVYKGVLNHGETIVAVKVFNIEQRGAFKSFMAECQALKNIRHRNLVKILTSCSSLDFEGNDFMALVYEFMPGGNLEQRIHPFANSVEDEQRTLNFVQRLKTAIDVATTLDYLHNNCHMQIIHCDLKPSNILFDDNLTAHLSDFGISRILSKATGRSQNETSSIGIKGSIGYIAPVKLSVGFRSTIPDSKRSQCSSYACYKNEFEEYGTGAAGSVQGDVYSFGILLLEMFTKKRPTDEMFKDNFTLHSYAEMALYDGVMAIIDPSLLPMEEDEEDAAASIANITRSRRCMEDNVRECLNLIIRIGVTCSSESPQDRMDIYDVVKELHLIRDIYLGVGTRLKIGADRNQLQRWLQQEELK